MVDAYRFEVLPHVEHAQYTRRHIQELTLKDGDHVITHPNSETSSSDHAHLVISPAKFEVHALPEADVGKAQLRPFLLVRDIAEERLVITDLKPDRCIARGVLLNGRRVEGHIAVPRLWMIVRSVEPRRPPFAGPRRWISGRSTSTTPSSPRSELRKS